MSPPPVPEPRLRRVRNRTPFALFQCDKMGVGRRFYDTVVLKGTFALAPGRLGRAREQASMVIVDEVWDPAAPERSSLKKAGEVVLTKPSTDVMVTGTARAPGGKPTQAWEAAIEVRRGGEALLAYRAQALGPRRFRHTAAAGWTLTAPEPTTEVPIRYELAYGGAYPVIAQGSAPASGATPRAPAPDGGEGGASPRWVVHAPNPSGTGFFDERAMDPALEYRAPQWQPREHPVTAPNREVPLTGFGPVARPWSSRLKYAGTYDDAWVRTTRAEVAEGLPADYAKDFDPRFFQCAHPSLIAPAYLVGDEEIVLVGLMPGEGPSSLGLPRVRVVADLLDGKEGAAKEALRLDTVHIDLDAATVSLCWRLTLDQARDVRTAAFEITEAA